MPKINSNEELNTDDSALQAISNIDFDCDSCKHIHRDGVTCEAFPNGIPIEILSNQKAHTKHYPNDNGIQFEEI
ncbi:hypothetical protein LCGC14_3114480 [marine sediment metagenome]|uniref:Uncharacterized protein n=1 Tax=marine sediment metagenome TaxID=412755 RepID=A0A0F8YBI9_9ZZZZ